MSGQAFGQADFLPMPYRPLNRGTVTPDSLFDKDLGTSLAFPRYSHSYKLHVRVKNVANSTVRMHGYGLDCSDVLVGMHIATSAEDQIAPSDIMLCSVKEIEFGTFCQSECSVKFGQLDAIIIMKSNVKAALCELESEIILPSIIPPFDINLNWKEFLQYLKGDFPLM